MTMTVKSPCQMAEGHMDMSVKEGGDVIITDMYFLFSLSPHYSTYTPTEHYFCSITSLPLFLLLFHVPDSYTLLHLKAV